MKKIDLKIIDYFLGFFFYFALQPIEFTPPKQSLCAAAILKLSISVHLSFSFVSCTREHLPNNNNNKKKKTFFFFFFFFPKNFFRQFNSHRVFL
jgi:uncharacterized membrane protein required for colicin V production